MIPGSNPESKFKIIGSYTALPGMCSSCGTSNGPAIDTGLSFDFYGAVVFCGDCARDLGRQAGLIDPGPNDAIVVDYDADFRHEIEEHLNGLSDLVAGLGNYLDGLPEPGTEPLPHSQDTCSGTEVVGKADSSSVRITDTNSDITVDKGPFSLSSGASSALAF